MAEPAETPRAQLIQTDARVRLEAAVLDQTAAAQDSQVTTEPGCADRECRRQVAGPLRPSPQQFNDTAARRVRQGLQRAVEAR